MLFRRSSLEKCDKEEYESGKEEYEKAKEMFYIINEEAINSKFDRFFNTYFIQDHIMENKKVAICHFIFFDV